jgi:signal recognition particle subunit SRP54
MMPGMPKELKGAKIDDDQLKPIEAIIRSMTPQERAKPEIMNGSRRTRVANGSGTTVSDVNKLIKQFQEMQKMMKRMGVSLGGGRGGKKGKKGKGGRRAPAGLPAGFGGPGGADLESLLGQLPAGMPGGFPGAPR